MCVVRVARARPPRERRKRVGLLYKAVASGIPFPCTSTAQFYNRSAKNGTQRRAATKSRWRVKRIT